MTTSKLLAAALIVSAASLVPTLSEARSHHHRHYGAHSLNGLPYPISYIHNYGPGPLPESFAYYDGPSTNHCYRSSAAYLGQDGDRHPCF